MRTILRNTSLYALALCATLTIVAPTIHAADLWADGNVPMSDQRDMRKVVVRTVAAHSSKDALSIVVYGRDPALLESLKHAARDAHQKGWPIRGIVVGSMNDPRGVDIYADGLLIAEQPAPGPHIYDQTMKALAYGNDLLKHELSKTAAH
jgi:hypothetical protein